MRTILSLALVLACTLALRAEPPRRAATSVFIVSGTIMSLAEDARGYPVQVEIQPNDGESYVVAADGKGPQLFRFVGNYVVASGPVTIDKDGWKTIHVINYQITDDDGTISPELAPKDGPASPSQP